jgi:multiple sugar transport system permease protein
MIESAPVSPREPSYLQQVRYLFFPDGLGSLARYLALLIVLALAVVALFPLYFALVTSFRMPRDIATVPPKLGWSTPSIFNYLSLFRGVGATGAPVTRWFFNSFVVTLASTVGVVLVAALAGYAFARKRFPGRNIIFWAILTTMLVPGWSTIIASYVLTLEMGLHDTYWGLILPGLASPFAVFLFRQFALTLPDELFQAAKIDGASELQIFSHVLLPLSRPVLAALAMFVLVDSWNEFLWPLLILNKQQLYTVPVGVNLLMYQIQGQGPDYGIGMAAAVVMSLLPIAGFLLVQRQMIEGLTVGALKG